MLPAQMLGTRAGLFVGLGIAAFVLAVLSACAVYFFTERAKTAWASVLIFMAGWVIALLMLLASGG